MARIPSPSAGTIPVGTRTQVALRHRRSRCTPQSPFPGRAVPTPAGPRCRQRCIIFPRTSVPLLPERRQVPKNARFLSQKSCVLQVRLELTTSALLGFVLLYKYRALTDCATGALTPTHPERFIKGSPGPAGRNAADFHPHPAPSGGPRPLRTLPGPHYPVSGAGKA